MSLLKSNQPAPDFSLPDQRGEMHRLSDYHGQWVLLYFYSKDDTPGCTKEACSIRDNFPAFEKIQVVVLGVSADSVKSHAKFVEKYNLPFTLLADEDKVVIKQYAIRGRTSFLINPAGDIVKIYEQVKPERHAAEVLRDVAVLAK